MSYAYVLLTGVGCVCGREDMVRQCLHEMKACFETCLASSQALEEAMARHFQPAGGQVRPIYTVQPPALTALPCAETAKLQRTRGRQGHVSLTMGVPPMLHIIVSSLERASMVFSLTYPSH